MIIINYILAFSGSAEIMILTVTFRDPITPLEKQKSSTIMREQVFNYAGLKKVPRFMIVSMKV